MHTTSVYKKHVHFFHHRDFVYIKTTITFREWDWSAQVTTLAIVSIYKSIAIKNNYDDKEGKQQFFNEVVDDAQQ